MKTYQVWLVLEETEDDAPQHQLETYQLSVSEKEEDGRAAFEAAQEVLYNHANNLENNSAEV